MVQTKAFGSNRRLGEKTLAMVLAGGRGSRLKDLTEIRAKPAVYFGGKFRIIDFALSNAMNSGIKRIAVATQYKQHSLIRHLQRGWNFYRAERNESFDIMPASQTMSDDRWYEGTADAVYQNIPIIESYENVEYIVVLAGDHIYKMDYELMLEEHVTSGADVTVGCLEVSKKDAQAFGVMHVDENDVITDFLEKPSDPPTIPGMTDVCLASMGIYVFTKEFLFQQLKRDAADPETDRDFGKNIIPYIVKHGKAQAHRFTKSCVRSAGEEEAYWRDVGTVDAYMEANLDLCSLEPALNLYDKDWPIWTYSELAPSAKFIHDEVGRRGHAVNSLVSAGCIVSGARVDQSLLFTSVNVHSYSTLKRAIVLPGVDIGEVTQLTNVVIDRGVKIPNGLAVGNDAELDAKRFYRTENGVCLITQAMIDAL
ncbi:glucose-1-phosphate adenylyltransferase [Algimonas arctica]|uniref:Glucose-1-phosphate adenylyltransferase n=1 Tax=Algimonas arctica TaxID=1479486 RepID=A0A8J3CP70_9PROT|nr:glucose-1-phosphate adenylyltransferase [Algimonas arctica]GHA86071.1 glucose-1-phosphate adenylyltransferase [Algimonas arctica]